MKANKVKSCLALLLTLCMCVSLMPAPAFAAGNTAGQKAPKAQEDPAVLAEQMLEELMQDAMLEGQPLTEAYYTEDVLAEINRTYADALAYIKDHPDDIGVWGIFIMLTEDVERYILHLQSLVEINRTMYSGPDDMDSLKKLLREKYDKIVKTVKRSDYNDWYWDLYQQQRAKAKGAIEGIDSLQDYIDASGEDLFISFAKVLEPDEDGGWDDEDSEFETTDLEDFLIENGIMTFSLVTKEMLEEFIWTGQTALEDLLEVEEGTVYKPFAPSKALKQKVAYFTRDAEKLEDHNKILKLYDSIYAMYWKEYEPYLEKRIQEDPDGELSYSDSVRWTRKMEQAYYGYDHRNYSPQMQEKLEEVYQEYSGQLDNCLTQKEASALWDKYIAAMNKVPVQAVELKDKRAKYIKKWEKKYRGKAYDQKKVKKILPKGKKALNSAKTVEELDSAYRDYTARLNGTLRMFKVKVSKKGKGTVSKGKTVGYGKTYTLKIDPAPGRALKSVTINGKKQSKLKYKYKIKIKKKTTIKVVFR